MQHSRGSVLEVKAKVCCLQLSHQLVFKRQKLTISRKNLKLQQEHHNRFGSRYISSIIFKGSPTGGLTTTPNTALLCFPHRNALDPSLWKRSATTTDATQNRNSSVPLTASSQTRADNPTNIRTRCAIYTPTVQFFNSNVRSAIEIQECYRNSRLICI